MAEEAELERGGGRRGRRRRGDDDDEDGKDEEGREERAKQREMMKETDFMNTRQVVTLCTKSIKNWFLLLNRFSIGQFVSERNFSVVADIFKIPFI